MNLNKQAHSYKKHSGRIIVDEYEQIKREREEEGLCQFCRNEIPLRLMNSHRNVCAFGASFHSFEDHDEQRSRSEGKMASSTYTQHNKMNKNSRNKEAMEQTPSKFPSQRYQTRPNNSALSQNKKSNKKVMNLDSGSVRNLSKNNKNQRESNRKLSSLKNKNDHNNRLFESRKPVNMQKFLRKEGVNKSMMSDQYGEYFGSIHKKTAASKIKKNAKNIWVEQSNQKKTKFKETQAKRENEKQMRQQKLKKLKNQTEKLKKQQQKLMQELEKQKKNSRHQNNRNRSQIKRQPRQPSGNQRRIPSRPRQNRAQNQNPGRSNARNQQRYPTAQQSYYEEVPINHPHRTMNFISQTINQQFQMMKYHPQYSQVTV